MDMSQSNRQQFRDQFEAVLGDKYPAAYELFIGYGSHLTQEFAKIVEHARQKGKLDVVLGMLRKHYMEHLIFFDLSVRGKLPNESGQNPTEMLFDQIYRDVLDLPMEDQSW